MATLTKPKSMTRAHSSPLLDSQIPSPFPREQLEHFSRLELGETADLALTARHEPNGHQVAAAASEGEEGFSIRIEPPASSNIVTLKDVMPSIFYVQKSCLMTLNNLLSGPIGWHPILPDRRHSMPPSSSSAVTSTQELGSSSSALQTLVTNLRNHEANGEMVEARDTYSDSDLLGELKLRIEAFSSSLSLRDASLAKALVSLLTDLNWLSEIQADISDLPSQSLDVETSSILDAPPPVDVFDTLTRQLSDLQIERLSSQAALLAPGASPLVVVETALLWSRIDSELENVVALCRERTEVPPKFAHEYLPPQYDVADYDFEYPPDYDMEGRPSVDDTKSTSGLTQQTNSARHVDEKMWMDFEAVTMAIDRLYIVAPQLHNQRVELKSTKLAQMEKARREGQDASSSTEQTRRAKGKERDAREFENLLDLIGKASERTLKDQSVVLDGSMQSRFERARRRESAKVRPIVYVLLRCFLRDAFVEQLVRHSEAGRIHGQDAVLPKLKDPEALLTLPEFMREPLPASERIKDDNALLTLPEFVKEAVPQYIAQANGAERAPSKTTKVKKERSRSLSAPPLAWLRSSSSRLSLSSSSNSSSSKGKSKASESHGFDVVYVAENHENLHHTLAFLTVTGVKPGTDLQAEVLPPFLDNPKEGGDHLVVKAGPYSSLPLMLPAHVTPGPKEVRAQSKHYEVKLTNLPTTPSSDPNEPISTPLLDASQLQSIHPTSFLCAHSSKVDSYRDLPSEHWEELVEAWMCHSDQKLHDQRFWPSTGEALVGGSYILFEESAMNLNNLHLTQETRHNDNWQLTRCLCGAIIGRCQERESDEGTTTIFRVLKYAVRPVSLTADPVKVPLSAFIVEDMTEFVQAHASYRFVIQDEEEEKPRILIWLFKPRIRLAYTTPTSRAIPRSANILAAKVLFKLLKPSETPPDIKSLLDRYPGFPQAEYLSYPMPICRRLAGLLRESNTAYPEGLRMMTGLEVGWLQRR
ncbi:HECT-like ubiquitin-conjugating enzyme-binding-domain-containing protein [Gymnopilus junonius]|uniref:HECT-like ubiquitin-conjugating enzyme-binding-domain-containing protein n=1 Tax=Gymnopilus junonius TaxID=109634 RepID=A0A9P5NQU5_GYMJU|nr:HECT-like ubiquitin-conjugating enzyme-binding-domain-containing protein [Gymnopilus junonius]